MQKYIIPNALQIIIDDLGWFCGDDDREWGGPSRTAMPRRHTAEDYLAVNELGKTLGMKINCAFVIGEWDPDNRLKKLPNFSKYGDGWDNAKYLGKEEMQRVADAVNASDYIDLSIHGLMHGYYTEGIDNYDASDFCYKINGKIQMIPEKEVRDRLDAFFGLLDYHGINKKVTSYIPSTAYYCYDEISKIMKDYGIDYICQPYSHTDFKGEEIPFLVSMENGIILTDRRNYPCDPEFNRVVDILPWDEWGSDFTALPKTSCVVGSHWPNYLHIDPKRSTELTERTAGYFKSCAEEFGTVMSRDLGFYSTQALYKRFSVCDETDRGFTIDLTGVPKAKGSLGKFCLSTREPIKEYSGCEISLYETRPDHLIYEITPKGNTITIS